MNNKIETILINRDITNEIESFDYEYSTRRDLVAFMISSDMNIDTNSFKKYEQEMLDFLKKFNQAKNKLELEYLRPAVKGIMLSWSLDYYTSIATVEVQE